MDPKKDKEKKKKAVVYSWRDLLRFENNNRYSSIGR